MNIKKLYDLMMVNFEISRIISTSSHIPGDIVAVVETELLIGNVYETKKPVSYPKGLGEQSGLRSIHKPVDVKYKNHKLRFGHTELHIREKNNPDNLQSLVMIYTGNTQVVPGMPTIRVTNYALTVFLLSNGVISTGILHSDTAFIQSWSPLGMNNYAGCPYTENTQDLIDLMNINFSKLSQTIVQPLNFLTDLYMLSKETYEKSILI